VRGRGARAWAGVVVAAFAVAVPAAGGQGEPFSLKEFPAGQLPSAVAVGNLNRDSKLDLAVTNFESAGTVSVLRGLGHARFSGPTAFGVGANPDGVAIGDFDGNGVGDLAVVNEGFQNGPSTVSVLLGRPNGSFRSPVNLGAGIFPTGLTLADFNGDGNLDVAVSNIPPGQEEGNIWIYLGDGAGGFAQAPGSPFDAGQTPTWLAAGDLNGDGNQDLVTTNWDPCLVSVFLGHGDGTFTSAPGSPYQGPMGDASVVLADFNGDGNLDAATGDLEHDSGAVMLGNGTGALQLLATYPTGQYTVQIVSADFNGDGNPDLATANRGTFPANQNGPPFTSSVSVLLGDGTGHFPTAISVPMGSGQAAKAPTGIAVGDFDRDGLPDLATSDLFTNSAGVLLNREG